MKHVYYGMFTNPWKNHTDWICQFKNKWVDESSRIGLDGMLEQGNISKANAGMFLAMLVHLVSGRTCKPERLQKAAQMLSAHWRVLGCGGNVLSLICTSEGVARICTSKSSDAHACGDHAVVVVDGQECNVDGAQLVDAVCPNDMVVRGAMSAACVSMGTHLHRVPLAVFALVASRCCSLFGTKCLLELRLMADSMVREFVPIFEEACLKLKGQAVFSEVLPSGAIDRYAYKRGQCWTHPDHRAKAWATS